MRNFRSPLLAPMPSTGWAERVGRIARRIAIAALLIGTAWFLIYTVAHPRSVEGGPLYWLYWLHDHLFLLVKGYSYTLYYPTSLVWWLLIAAVLLIWLISFMSDGFIIRFPHIVLARLIVRYLIPRNARLRSILISTVRWLNWLGFEPGLLKAVVERERALALNRLIASPLSQASHEECNDVAYLTELSIHLLLLPRSTVADRLDAAARWHQAFLQIRLYGKKPTDSLSSLAECIDGIIYPILNRQTSNQLEEAPEQSAFDPKVIALDLKTLRDLGMDIATGLIENRDKLIGSRLPDSVEARRTILDRVRSQSEMLDLQRHPSPVKADIEDIAKKISSEDTNLPAIGQSSLTIALDLAALADDPEIALGYIDSIETLAFALGFEERDANELTPDQGYGRLRSLIGDLPRPEDYRLCAKLAKAKLEKRRTEWEKRSSYSPDDFELAEARIASLCHAAGPDPD